MKGFIMLTDYGQRTRINLLRFASILLILCLFDLLASETTAQEVTPHISNVAWSPDGSMIAVGYKTDYCVPEHPEFYDIKIYNSNLTQHIQTLSGSTCSVTSVDWSPDGARLAASSLDSIGTRVWDIQTCQLIMVSLEHGQGVAEVRWRPSDGLQLADAAISNGIGLLDPSTGAIIGLARIGGTALDWSPDGSRLASVGIYENTVYIADMIIGQEIMALQGHTGVLNAIDWSPDGTKLASGGGLDDPSIRVWDAVTGENLLILQGHTTAISQVRWSPDSSRLASASSDGTVRIWDATTGEVIAVIEYGARVYSVDWHPDGTQLVFGGISTDGQDAQIMMVSAPSMCTLTIPASDTPTLLSAITSANASPEPDTICLEAGTYTLDAPITSEITLVGLGSGAEISGTLHVSGAGRLTLRNVVWSPQ